MNFTSQIKEEIISLKMNQQEISYFIKGVLFCNRIDNSKEIKVKFNNLNFSLEFQQLLSKSNFDFKMENNLLIFNQDIDFELDSKLVNYLFAGIFFSSGSISNLNSSSYHLEINFKSEEICDFILDFAKKHILFGKVKNKNYYVLYLKKNEAISDFLQIINAKKNYFTFIDSIIERDFKNQITRIFNLDLHNQNRLVESNQQFLEQYEYILKNQLENQFTKDQLSFYEFKKDHPFLSLAQLSFELEKQLKIKKTKSGLNHWLIKLRLVCEEYENKMNLLKKGKN